MKPLKIIGEARGQAMWWEPKTEDEQAISETAARVNDYFLTPSRTISAVYGVGTTTDETGRRVLLLVLDRSFAPRRLFNPIEWWLDFSSAFLPFNLRSPRLQRASLLTTLRVAGPRAQNLLRQWSLPEDTHLLFSEPPVPLRYATRTQIWANNNDRYATLGFVLNTNNRIIFTTAGHLVTVLPCRVSSIHHNWFLFSKRAGIGLVEFYNDPTTKIGVDIALVAPAPEYVSEYRMEANSSAPLADMSLITNFNRFNRVVLQGGKSGIQQGWILAALMSSISFDRRYWKNCWAVMEIDHGFAQPGDSGAPVVLDESSAILGHLIAAFGAVRPSGRYQVGLVQDIHTIREFVQDHYASSVTIVNLA